MNFYAFESRLWNFFEWKKASFGRYNNSKFKFAAKYFITNYFITNYFITNYFITN